MGWRGAASGSVWTYIRVRKNLGSIAQHASLCMGVPGSPEASEHMSASVTDCPLGQGLEVPVQDST